MIFSANSGFTVHVAPFAGAWIEIIELEMVDEAWDVAPFAGAWIEILLHLIYSISYYVAPFAGAWIEINVRTSAPV